MDARERGGWCAERVQPDVRGGAAAAARRRARAERVRRPVRHERQLLRFRPRHGRNHPAPASRPADRGHSRRGYLSFPSTSSTWLLSSFHVSGSTEISRRLRAKKRKKEKEKEKKEEKKKKKKRTKRKEEKKKKKKSNSRRCLRGAVPPCNGSCQRWSTLLQVTCPINKQNVFALNSLIRGFSGFCFA